jgi:hypothetical protein
MHARPVREQWVFGIYDTVKKVGHIEIVPDRSEETLIPIVERWVLPGTTIRSDGWGAYASLGARGYVHEVVIHEHFFVDPVTGVDSNSVENYWQRCKRRFKRVYGVARGLIPSYLDEFMWLERYGRTFSQRWVNTLSHMGGNRTDD